MNSDGWSRKSSLVTTAFTPGSCSAFDVSIDTMRAWAWGLRSTRPTSWPGRLKSAPKRARPVTLSWPSGRTVRVPTYDCGRSWMSVSAMSARPHFRGSVHHRSDDLVVPRAAAEIARQPVPDLRLRRILSALEERLRRHDEPGRADAALQRRMLEELLLDGVQRLAGGHALDGLDGASAHLAPEHEARADQPPVEQDAAGPAVARRAALLAPRQVQRVAEHVEERVLRLAEELDVVPVHRCRHVILRHQFALARSSAINAARLVSTAATSMRKSMVPRLSSIGRQIALAAASSRSCAGRSSVLPMIAWAAAGTSSTFSATAPSDTRAAVTLPPPSTVK